ncbi:MAG: preprotein translocase subunit SecY [Ruminococcaceae bacterium]|nr:preprotein translocase subunit SecY [Oscillospiraceae bacterium]
MFKTLKNAWKTPELQKKMLFTLFIVLLYRLGACICVPYVSPDISTSFESLYGSSVLGLMSILSGGAMQYATLFALSVSPYITASIVIQLLTIAIPALERWAKDGANGQKKIAALTRYVTIALALVTSYGYSMLLKSQGWLVKSNWFAMLVINASFCAGAALVMWLAELINEKGIGNGISIILFANIVATLPGMVLSMWDGIIMNGIYHWAIGIAIAIAVLAVVVATIGFVVWVTNSERRIPIQYAKRVVGRKMYGGQATNLPIKLNMTGVMPIIFASSIVSIPATITAFMSNQENGFVKFVENFFSPTTWPYLVVYLLLIIAFSYFYVMISFNPVEVANNIAANGGSVRGMRPGRPTVQYIQKILKRVTLIGAFFLCIVAGLPMLVTVVTTAIQNLNPTASMPDFSILTFGGSSLLIVVGVALETVRDLEAQLSLRASKGFLG